MPPLHPVKLSEGEFGIGWTDQTGYITLMQYGGKYKTAENAERAISKRNWKYPFIPADR